MNFEFFNENILEKCVFLLFKSKYVKLRSNLTLQLNEYEGTEI